MKILNPSRTKNANKAFLVLLFFIGRYWMKKNDGRILATLNTMEDLNFEFLIVSSKENIRYLFGQVLETGKRLSAVIVKSNGDMHLIINQMFSDKVIHVSNMKIHYYNDGENPLVEIMKALPAGGYGGIDQTFNIKDYLEIVNNRTDVKLVLSNCVEKIREIKETEEINLLRQSSRIADAVMHQIVQLQSFPDTEESIERIIKGFFREYDVSHLTFNPIIASSDNTANPHHIPSYRFTEMNKPLLIDLGGKYQGYCSDTTRMFYFSEADKKFLSYYEYLKEAQNSVLEIIKPGIEIREIELFIRDYLKKKNLEELFIHGTGHGIGLEAYESPNIHSQNKEIVKEGMVITVGPGLYARGEFGMRIEDVICVTENGYENFNKSSKDLVLLEFH